MDPLELRKKNWIEHHEFPYDTVSGMTYDSGNYEAATEKAVGMFDYDGLRAEQKQRRDAKDPVQLGIGISTFTEMCGLAPSRLLGSLGYGAGGWEAASVRMLATGKVEVVTGTSPHGQGHETAWSQIVADRLGVHPDDIEVLHGDTLIAPFGRDTYGSRSLAVGGTAVYLSAGKVLDKARLIAAHLLEADQSDLQFEGGAFSVAGTSGPTVTIQEVAGAASLAANLPEGMEPNLTADSAFDPPNFTWPFGTHICVSEVDVETGFTRIRRYVAVDDCGVLVNPTIVEGQLHGGIAQGIGQALYEHATFDAQGQPTAANLATYTVPTATDLPYFELEQQVTPSPTNPMGVKGIGESGAIGSSPAVVNAVIDALAHLGVTHVDMPATPQAVWRAITAATGQAS
jgi:aerobic carbon-monoxide dehydrogenase large subunit